MSLIKWGLDDGQDKNDPFVAPTMRHIQSVQSAWQPTTDSAATNSDGTPSDQPQQPQQPQQDNYLLSDQHAQVDEELRQRKAAEAAAQAEANRQAAAARAAAAAEAEAVPANVPAQPKYAGNPKKKSEGFLVDTLKNIGAGIQQGFGALGDIAIEGGGVIGSIGKNDQQLVQHMNEVEKVRNWLHGLKDINGQNITGTRDVDQNAANIANGRGTVQDYAAVGGKGLQAGLDATMFMNPARLATTALPEVTRASTMLGRVATNPAVRYAGRDAAFYGGLQGTATTAQQYGATGDLEKSLEAGAKDAIMGGTLQGVLDLGGHGIHQAYQHLTPVVKQALNKLPVGERLPVVEDAVSLIEDAALTPQQRLAQAESNVPAVDAPTRKPNDTQDGNVSFEQNLQTPTLDSVIPIADHFTPAGISDTMPTLAPNEAAPVADGIASSQIDPSLPATTTPTPVTDTKPADGVALDAVTPVADAPKPAGDVAPTPVADGVVNPSQILPATDVKTPMVKSDQVRALQEAKAGASQADEAAINQQLNEMQAQTPVDNSVPDGMDTPPADVQYDANGKPLVSRQDIADRYMSVNDDSSRLKQQLATAVGMAQDTGISVPELLANSKLSDKAKTRTIEWFNRLDEVTKRMNQIQNEQKKAFVQDGTGSLSEDLGREHSTLQAEKGQLQANINGYIRKIQGQSSVADRVANALENVAGARNSSLLSSVGGIERNFVQDTMANVVETFRNPGKMIGGLLTTNAAKSAVKETIRGWQVKPKTVSESLPYFMGNIYRSLMTLTTAMANVRTNVGRRANAELALRMAGEPVTEDAIRKMVSAGGSDSELIAHTMAGVANGMTSSLTSKRVTDAYVAFLRTGSDADKARYMANVEKATSLARKLSNAAIESHDPSKRAAGALINVVLPFVSTPANLAVTTVHQIANPMGRSVTDQLLKDVRTNPQNIAALIKDKAIDYGMVAVVGALVSADVIGYNDGEDPSKPQGLYIHAGGDNYISARATNIELPIAVVTAGMKMTQDIINGTERPPMYYLGIVGNSLPYVDSTNNAVLAASSAVGEYLNGDGTQGTGDNGYAAKSYAVNMAKSFVPYSNNGVMPAVAGVQGKSVNAKSSYDKNPVTWFGNTVSKGFMTEDQYNKLKDSRDAAGRVRTVDNQGVIINKHINDASTAEFNAPINDLVKYGRENGLNNGTQDAFNTYDTGKNNNFHTAQGAIAFLDVPQGGKPDNADKLKKNPKLTDLSQQIKNGFFGDTGSELLTLDGKNLKSDASVPNKDGSKNSNLPMSMQSIKNAIAQTDLPKDQTDKLYQYSQAKTDLYNQLKAKSITYDQYTAAKQDIEKGEVAILSGSKNYAKMDSLMKHLNDTGFFDDGGLGSTKSGQTYLWNSLNALLGNKGATPATNYPDSGSSFTPWGRGGRGNGRSATDKPGDRGNRGIKWTPVVARGMASVAAGKYTPVDIKVRLGNAVKKNKTQNYSDRSF